MNICVFVGVLNKLQNAWCNDKDSCVINVNVRLQLIGLKHPAATPISIWT